MPVTYEEMNKARSDFEDARRDYNLKYHDFLTTVLQEAGVYKKLVKLQGYNLVGQFQISNEPYGRRPWEIKFYPITLSGKISMKSKYISDFHSWKEDSLVQQLKNLVEEVVGDLP